MMLNILFQKVYQLNLNVIKSKNIEFPCLNSLAKHLKRDGQVIRDYLKGDK